MAVASDQRRSGAAQLGQYLLLFPSSLRTAHWAKAVHIAGGVRPGWMIQQEVRQIPPIL